MLQRVEAAVAGPRPLQGILLALLAFGFFTFMDTVVKVLGGRYHLLQVMFFSSVFGLLVTGTIAAWRGPLVRLRTQRPGLHLLRWAISFSGAFCVFYAYVRLPLADVYAILFTAPLLITALSVPLLGERVGWRRWTAIAVGFSGVLVMLRPGSTAVDEVALFALAGALAHSMNMILVRKLGQTDPPEIFGLFGNTITILLIGAILPFIWQPMTWPDFLTLALGGASAGGGFWLLASAFRVAPAAIVAPFQYSQMPYGLLVGWLLFATVPDGWTIVGAFIVIGSGLYVLQREAYLLRAARRAPP